MHQTRVCVTGAAGFIAAHLCRYLHERGYYVRAVDYVLPRYGDVTADEHDWTCDLRDAKNAARAVKGMDWVFHLAADMGGALHVFSGDNDMEIIRNNTLIDVNMIEAARLASVNRFLFSSSACVYPERLQDKLEENWLKESDAYPAGPDSIYGWCKMHSEHLCQAYQKATEMEVRIARQHNIYGERGAWRGPWDADKQEWKPGREKAPAAMCRRIGLAKYKGETSIQMWGDGEQVRSFCHISDAVELLHRLMISDFDKPLNIGTDEAVSINQLAALAMEAADYQVEIEHIEGPQGVRYRNADLRLMREVLGYSPQVSLAIGIMPTFDWIYEQIENEYETAT